MHLNYHYEEKKASTAELNPNDKPKRKVRIWEERFNRKIYDYEIQESMYKFQIRAIAPRFRIVGNLGHGPDSTHTKFATPKYLRRPLDNRLLAPRIDFKTLKTVERVILDFMDSKTFGGDSIFSVRGRTFGIRSLFRSLLK
jgi:hypothetical protein